MAAKMTNTVHVALPEKCNLIAACSVFQKRFGEVMAAEPLEPPRAAISFFDVRSAARAVEALGRAYCAFGPQTGDRRVRLAADAQFDTADFAGVSNVIADDESGGTFVLEFYDVRDARRYRKEAAKPAAVGSQKKQVGCAFELPPGLEQRPATHAKALGKSGLASKPRTASSALAPPPGLVPPLGLQAPQPLCEVRIRGLPKKLLSEPMMEAILQQAGFANDVVAGFSAKPGEPCGEAVVRFSCEASARRCVAHFAGCQWGQSHGGVTAAIVQGMASGGGETFAAQQVLDASATTTYSSEGTPSSSRWSVGAPAYVPVRASALAASAPEFVPVAFAKEGRLAKASRPRETAKRAHGPASDTSTEIGDSDEEKSGPMFIEPVLSLR